MISVLFSDTNSECNAAPIFDLASVPGEYEADENFDEMTDTPTLHNGNNGFRVGPLELCRAWQSFRVSIYILKYITFLSWTSRNHR